MSKVAHPNDDEGMKGQIGLPRSGVHDVPGRMHQSGDPIKRPHPQAVAHLIEKATAALGVTKIGLADNRLIQGEQHVETGPYQCRPLPHLKRASSSPV